MASISIPLGPTEVSRHAAIARALGMFSFPVVVMATLFHRLGIASTGDALAALLFGLALGALAVLLGLYALMRIWIHGYAGAPSASIGTVWGFATIAPALMLVPLGFVYPAINQVSTDLNDPPAFVWVDRARGPRLGPVPAMTPEMRAQQAAAYPRVVQLRVDMSGQEAYQLALQLVERQRWTIQDRRPPQTRLPGRIEATARTTLFGFPDDIVIRITPSGNEARIDMRSASRYGRADFGTNAQRVSQFLTEMRDRALER